MEPVKFVGSLVKFGARRAASSDKIKTLQFEVHGAMDDLDFLMDKPLEITIKITE